MSRDRPLKAVGVTLAVALVCSVLVSGVHAWLKPIQRAYADLDRYRRILEVAGLGPPAAAPDTEVARLVRRLDARVVELASGGFSTAFDPWAGPPAGTGAGGLAVVYLVREQGALRRVILPLEGPGMWATIRGYLALGPDCNTIADVVFHEHGETPGIGDQIEQPGWRAGWRGRQMADEDGQVRFTAAPGPVQAASPEARFQVDAIGGATITVNAVIALTRSAVGPERFGPLLRRLCPGPGEAP